MGFLFSSFLVGAFVGLPSVCYICYIFMIYWGPRVCYFLELSNFRHIFYEVFYTMEVRKSSKNVSFCIFDIFSTQLLQFFTFLMELLIEVFYPFYTSIKSSVKNVTNCNNCEENVSKIQNLKFLKFF
jgi:hypothetical protein